MAHDDEDRLIERVSAAITAIDVPEGELTIAVVAKALWGAGCLGGVEVEDGGEARRYR
jgi:hypothetical protein